MGQLSFGTTADIDARLFVAGVDVSLTNETLSNCVQNTWYSPTTAALTGYMSNNFTYSGGQIVYTGDEDIKVIMASNVSISVSGFAADVELTNGKNNTQSTVGVMPATSILGGQSVIATYDVFDITNGDTLDFWLRQTSETDTPDIEIAKGRFIVLKVN